MLQKWLWVEKAPYVVSLFILALGWTITRTADSLSKSPFLEYRLDHTISTDSTKSIRVRLRNTTKSISFGCFALTVASPNPAALRFVKFEQQVPELYGNVFVKMRVTAPTNDSVAMEWRNVTPGADAAIVLPTQGEGVPRLLVSECPDNAGEKSQLPIPVPRSLTTFFVEHEISALWGALSAWLVVLTAIAFFGQRGSPSGGAHKEEGFSNEDIAAGG